MDTVTLDGGTTFSLFNETTFTPVAVWLVPTVTVE